MRTLNNVQNSGSSHQSPERVEHARTLWKKVVESGYLDVDTYQRSVKQTSQHRGEIWSFLKTESVILEDRPNAAHTLALLSLWLPASNADQDRDALFAAFMRKGLSITGATPEDEEQRHDQAEERAADLGLDEITAAIEIGGTSYVARTGPYSSIYAALLALLLDEITIREQLESIANVLENPHAGGQFVEPVMQPGEIFQTAYYRGQREDLPPLPKTLRPGKPGQAKLRLYRRLRHLAAEAKFGAALASLNLPPLRSEQLDAIRQHYGFPTSLLDFTTNLEVAAFFATRGGHVGDIGAIYRYHLAHPYALTMLGSLRGVAEVGGQRMQQKLQRIANRALKSLRIVDVAGVERIRRQDGVFIDGIRLWAVHNFLQPIRFVQHESVAFEEPTRNITEEWLFPTDDRIDKLAAPIVKVFA